MSASADIQTLPLTDKSHIFLTPKKLTNHLPLRVVFYKGQTQFTAKSRDLIAQWARTIVKFEVPVYIYSYASKPSPVRDGTIEMAQHETLRLAFNRGLIAKSILIENGIAKKRLIVKTFGPGHTKNIDEIIISIRNQ